MQIGVLGPLRVIDGDAELALPGRRQRALVCRLAAVPGQLVMAGTLVEDLWDGLPPPGASSTLQSHVSAVRKVLGTASIRSAAGGYRLTVDPDDVDAHAAWSLAAAAREDARRDAWAAAVGHAEDALRLYRGPPYLDAEGAAWVRGESSRLSELRLELVELRLDGLLVLGDNGAAAAEAEAALADAPLRERLWSQLMLALHRAGRRPEALRAYQRVRRTFGEELGLEPSAELGALEAAIATGDPALAARLPWAAGGGSVGERKPARVVAGPPVAGSARAGQPAAGPPVAGGVHELPAILRDAAAVPTVGRAAARAVLDAAFTAVAGGAGSTVVVAGEGGIGKTTLLAQATAAAAESGVAVLYGRCLADGELCYQPFVDALGAAPAGLRAVAHEELAQLGPLAGAAGHGLPADRSGDATVDRYLLFQGVERALAAFAAQVPVVLVLDDLHWADDGTVALTRHLADRVVDGPLALAIGVRTVDVDPDGPVAGLLTELHRVRGVQRVDLDGLDRGEIADLATRFGSPPSVAERVAEVTAGNPYFVAELLRHGWVGLDGGPALPTTVTDMVRRRAGTVGPDAPRLLGQAAVLGSTFDAPLLADVTGRPLDEVLDVVEAAIERGLVVEEVLTGAPGTFAFTHAIAGTALAESLSATRRRGVHRRAAVVLGERRRVAPAALAQHWLAGYGPADIAAVVDSVRAAGDDALAQLVPSEALQWFDRGLALVDGPGVSELGGDGQVHRARLLVGRARALFDLNDPLAGATLREAAALAATCDDAELLAAAALTGSRGFASSLQPIRVRRSRLLEQAIDAGPSPATRSRLLADLATELMMVDGVRASALAEEAIALARTAGDEPTLLHALKRAAAVGSPVVADWMWPLLDEATALAARLGDRLTEWELASTIRLLAPLRADRARLDTAAAAVVDAGPLVGLPRVRFSIALDQARVALIDGRPFDARRHLDELMAIGAAHDLPDAPAFHHIYTGSLQRQLGELGQWEPLPPHLSFDAAAAVALVDLGEVGAAADRLDAALVGGDLGSIPMSTFWLSEVACWGYVAARLGRADVAGTAMVLLAPHAHRTCEFCGPVSHVVGLCAAVAAAEPASATAWLEAAEAAAVEQRLDAALARVRLDLALLAAAAGDVDRAAILAADAGRLARERGFTRLAQHADAVRAGDALQ